MSGRLQGTHTCAVVLLSFAELRSIRVSPVAAKSRAPGEFCGTMANRPIDRDGVGDEPEMAANWLDDLRASWALYCADLWVG